MKQILIVIFLVQFVTPLLHADILGKMPPLSAEYSKVQDETAIPNMPRVRSQDSVGICFGFSAATIAQHYYCKEAQVNCANTSAQNEVSPLGMVSWFRTNKPGQYPGDPQTHSNITLEGVTSTTLKNAARASNHLIPESCYNFDKFANRYGSDQRQVNAIFASLKNELNKSKTEAGSCVECIKKISEEKLGHHVEIEQITFALNSGSFEGFLYDLFYSECVGNVKIKSKPKFEEFPVHKGTATGPQVISKIKDVLKTGYPVSVEDICAERSGTKCTGLHSFVVSGYRKVCKSDGSTCRDMVKVHNSWGADWQRVNNDGWVDAQTVFSEKSYVQGTVSWWKN